MDYKNIRISDYLYQLPDDKIAQYPLDKRDTSKLLVYNVGKIKETKFDTIDEYIPTGSLVILNNTKVIPARLFFYKGTGAKIEIFCLEPASDSKDFQVEFGRIGNSEWNCFVGNASKWKNGKIKTKFYYKDIEYDISAIVKNKNEDVYSIEFHWNSDEITFSEVIESLGKIPLPPYIKRESEESDKDKYQTVYAKIDGSVAAPTAGLHFTENEFNKLKLKNCVIDYLTLNVGAGTFKPVKSETIGGHKMHREIFCVSENLLKNILKYKDTKITAVGTTTLRTLESIYWYGVKLLKGESSEFKIEQWYPYENEEVPLEESLNAILNFMEINNINNLFGETELMIVPGYKFKIVDALITNFHLPGSTLLLLISAFVGDDWKLIYDYALKNDFRFLSYGDSSILIKD